MGILLLDLQILIDLTLAGWKLNTHYDPLHMCYVRKHDIGLLFFFVFFSATTGLLILEKTAVYAIYAAYIVIYIRMSCIYIHIFMKLCNLHDDIYSARWYRKDHSCKEKLYGVIVN